MIDLLDNFARLLGLWCFWRNVRQCDIKAGQPPRTWREFLSRIADDRAIALQRRRALAEANIHGSYDGVADFTDSLREQRADFAVLVRLPGSKGTLTSASVSRPGASEMTDALLDLAMRVAVESEDECEPGEEWKKA
jgi:hypothetical protein